MKFISALLQLIFMNIPGFFYDSYENSKQTNNAKKQAKQNNLKELILTSIGSFVFMMWSGYSADNTTLFIYLFMGAYICSLAYLIFAFTSKERNGCLLIILSWAPFIVALILFPISIPVVLFFINKTKKYNYNKEQQLSQKAKIGKELDKILQKCKQDGSLDDIEQLKNLVEQNIKTNGSNIEFLKLNFSIAKLYNNQIKTEKANEYFNKVKSIVSSLDYEDLCLVAKNSIEKNDLYDAIFYYTYMLLYGKAKDNRKIPDIYYNRALAYLGINQIFYKNKAIEDLKTAIEKTKSISDSLSYVEVESFLNGKLDKYYFKIGEIYQEIKEYAEAINYYKQITNNSKFYSQIQEKIIECEKEQTVKNERQANAMYKRALEEYENGQFIMAEQTIHSAIKLVNKVEYNELLKEIISGIKEDNKKNVAEEKEVIQTKVDKNNKTKPLSKNKKIKLESCSKADLLTIDGFDEEKADKFIQERDNGKIYYDIDNFVFDYGLMPHQMIEIQERLVFSPKPKNKMGRKIDW